MDKKKAAAFSCNRFRIKYPPVPLCRHPEPKVQGGHSQFNFGFIGLATRTPIEQNSATDAHKWFKEYMAIANTAGDLSLL